MKSQYFNNPYPESVFPALNDEELEIVVKAIQSTGFTSDRVYGSWGRRVWDNAVRDVIEYLDDANDLKDLNDRLLELKEEVSHVSDMPGD